MSKELVQETIGTILQGRHERDAIHIAVVPVIAGEEYMHPGSGVAIVYGTPNVACHRPLIYGGAHGVVDPFLQCIPRKGDQFWMFLLPNTVTNLRHQWTCPAIDNRPGMDNEHTRWLQKFADKWNFDYNEMIAEASSPSSEPEEHFVVARGIDLHSADELGEDHDLFWQHLEALTGMKFDGEHRERFCWSCSC